MSKLLCSDCQLELRCTLNEVVVLEFSQHGPYKLWYADEFSCPSCDRKTITGWGATPFWTPERGPDFPKQLIEDEATEGRLRYHFEDSLQRALFLAMEPEKRHHRLSINQENIEHDLSNTV